MVVIDCLLVDLHGAGGPSFLCQGNPFSSLGRGQSASKTTQRESLCVSCEKSQNKGGLTSRILNVLEASLTGGRDDGRG